MKRIISFIIAIIIISSVLCIFTSCGNKNYFAGNYNFTKIHILSGDKGHCYDIESWKEADVGIEVKLTGDHGALWCSEGTYVLVESYCPVCGR